MKKQLSIILLSVLTAAAQTTNVSVTTEISQENVFPAFVTGFGFGLTVFGFGMILRIIFRGSKAIHEN